MTSSIDSRGALTLIELLALVAIIALLVSILTPSLGCARQPAKSVVCLSRLNKFMQATVADTADSHGALPPIPYQATQEISQITHGWAAPLYRVTDRRKGFGLTRAAAAAQITHLMTATPCELRNSRVNWPKIGTYIPTPPTSESR